jgi:hypothetical protein
LNEKDQKLEEGIRISLSSILIKNQGRINGLEDIKTVARLHKGTKRSKKISIYYNKWNN